MNVNSLADRQLHGRSLELAALAVDFDLTRAEMAELETHLAGCATCARRAAAMRGDALALGRSLTLTPSSRVDAAIYAEIARHRPAPQRLVLLVAAAVLLLLALVGVATIGAQLLRTVPLPPNTILPPVRPPAALFSPRPGASPAAIGEAWEAIDFPAGSLGSMEAVTFAGRTEMIGVGGGGCIPEGQPPTQCYAAAWTARLGDPWLRAPDRPSLEVGAAVGTSSSRARLIDVAAGVVGTVAIGYATDGQSRVVFSGDGQNWQPVTLDRGPSTGVVRVAAVEAAGSAGFVIVGSVVDSQGARARAAAWTSPDGMVWTRAQDTADMDVGQCFVAGDDLSCGGMLGVVATASGFVAIGSDHARLHGTEPSRPTAWTSRDGLTWSQSWTGLDFVGLLNDIEAGGPGLVAVGTTCPPGCFESTAGAVAATSIDGSTWKFEKVAGAVGPQHVASIGGRVYALGALNRDVDPFPELQLWQTDDGVAWQRMTDLPALPGGYRGADIAAAKDRLVIVGWQSTSAVDGATSFAFTSPPGSDGSADIRRAVAWSMPAADRIDVTPFELGVHNHESRLFELDTWPDPDRSAGTVITRHLLADPTGEHFAMAETDPRAKTRVRIVTRKGAVVWSTESANGVPALAWSTDGSQLAVAFAPAPWRVVTLHAGGAPTASDFSGLTSAPLQLLGFSADGLSLLAYDGSGEGAPWEHPYTIDLARRTATPVDRFPGGAGGIAVSNTTTMSKLVDPVTGRVLDGDDLSGRQTNWTIRHGAESIELGVPLSNATTNTQLGWADDGSIVVLETSLDNGPPSNDQQGSTLSFIRQPSGGAQPAGSVKLTWGYAGPFGSRSRADLVALGYGWVIVGQYGIPSRDDAWLGYDEMDLFSLASNRDGLMSLSGNDLRKRELHVAGLID